MPDSDLPIELFVLDEAVAALREGLAAASGSASEGLLEALAWHLRQRDCAAALRYADQGYLFGRPVPADALFDLAEAVPLL